MELILTVALGAAIAGFVQGLSGFGFGLTAMALWAWTLEPRLAAALSVFGALVGQLLAAFTVRRGWDFKTLLPFLAGGLAGLPLGLYLLPRLDVPLFKAVLGAMMVIVCPLMFFASRLPRVDGGRTGDALAGAAGGVMGGLGGFTGVVPTLWCTVRGFDKDRQRSIIQNFNLAMQVVTFASYLATGILEPRMLPLLAVVAPAVLVPVLLGARVYIGISDLTFRKVVLGLLTASGVALLAASVPVLLSR
ncbi:sulfite exporter TauE/SafE family protein [Ramlibacter monticola]|uniref:Probable membrane transporter protein n=1 Tax=Ramlibacter monticola TaxID=1926872 RepID=A0A937CXJ5_9BURK|nr:sulfite exporter TauE/SafE family protein [Ramlibacter monticola]MBL0395074.1 sulfite exporter TauE/SafE family protein [Ramlibacter monticola]